MCLSNKNNYEYTSFMKESQILVDSTISADNFKWDICKPCEILPDSIYLKGQIEKKIGEKQSFLLELNILYSEVYQMPVLYFIIYDLNTMKIVEYEEYTENVCNMEEEDGNTICNWNKSYEIKKSVSVYFIKF